MQHPHTYASLEPWRNRIRDEKPKSLHEASVASALSPKALFLFFDTETTGLNKSHTDEIHELAMIATDRHMKIVDQYHGLSRVQDKHLLTYHKESAYSSLKIIYSDEEIVHLYWHIMRRLASAQAKKGVEFSYTEVVYNYLQDHVHEKGKTPGDRSLKPLYDGLIALARGYKYHWVLKLTKYNHTDPKRVEHERMLANDFSTFSKYIFDTNRGKHDLVLVGQNIKFDIAMVAQSMMNSAAKPYGEYSRLAELPFIDTNMMMRRYVNRYNYVQFKYWMKQWQQSHSKIAKRDEGLLKTCLSFEPIRRNKLGYITEFFDIPNDNWHSALNDVHCTVRVLEAQLAYDLMIQEMCDENSLLKEINQAVTMETSNKARYDMTKGEMDILEHLAEVTASGEDAGLAKHLIETTESIRERHAGLASSKNLEEQDFIYVQVDPYRRKHTSEFKTLLKKLEMDPEGEDWEFNEPAETDNEEEFQKKIDREFPGASEKFYVDVDAWREKSLI